MLSTIFSKNIAILVSCTAVSISVIVAGLSKGGKIRTFSESQERERELEEEEQRAAAAAAASQLAAAQLTAGTDTADSDTGSAHVHSRQHNIGGTCSFYIPFKDLAILVIVYFTLHCSTNLLNTDSNKGTAESSTICCGRYVTGTAHTA